MEWSQQIVLVLLEEYQKREILWKPRHPLYYNTIKKEDGWREIAAILNVEVQELKKKMESLKGSFRREKSRVKKGTGTEKVYGTANRCRTASETGTHFTLRYGLESDPLTANCTIYNLKRNATSRKGRKMRLAVRQTETDRGFSLKKGKTTKSNRL
nr:unnamed protein product [Callosobruchus chinensis]